MDYLNAFLCGGVLCAAGQLFIDRTQLTPARILTGYVVDLSVSGNRQDTSIRDIICSLLI